MLPIHPQQYRALRRELATSGSTLWYHGVDATYIDTVRMPSPAKVFGTSAMDFCAPPAQGFSFTVQRQPRALLSVPVSSSLCAAPRAHKYPLRSSRIRRAGLQWFFERKGIEMKIARVEVPRRNPLVAAVMKKAVQRHGKTRKAERRTEKSSTCRGYWSTASE